MAVKSYVPPDQRPVRMSRAEMDALTSPDIKIHSAALLAGVANVIMQLANAPVGRGVVESRVESGSLLKHPVKRTRTTLSYLSVAALGNAEDRKAYREAVNSAHRQVHSTAESPVKYNAMDPKLQLWVTACLYKGWEDVALLYGKPGEVTDEAYQQGAVMGTTLQVPREMWPATRADFQQYWDETVEGIEIDPEVRDYLMKLTQLRFHGPRVGRIFSWFSEALTLGYLPPEFRDKMNWYPSRGQQRFFQANNKAIRLTSQVTPNSIQVLPFRLLLEETRWRRRTGRPLI